MRFSQAYSVTRTDEDDWFDTIMSVDVGLFIDPMLVWRETEGIFANSGSELADFFQHIFELVAASGGRRTAKNWQRAIRLLSLAEPAEFCLGYTGDGTRGSGTGKGLADLTARAAWQAISVGIAHIDHFEEIQLFQLGIGPDRISDDTARILLHRFIKYTEGVAVRHNIPTKRVFYGEAKFDLNEKRWASLQAHLPMNPHNSKPVLLCPERFLRELPTINADDFLHYFQSVSGDEIFKIFGEEINRKLKKEEIIRIALTHPEIVKDYDKTIGNRTVIPYNFQKDPKLLVDWYDTGRTFAFLNPFDLDQSDPNWFEKFVLGVIRAFKHYVEEQNGWRMLTNDDGSPRKERASQDLLLGVMLGYCETHGVTIAREADVGRGPVDFLLAGDRRQRAHVELKLARNTRGLDGVLVQLPTYLKADKATFGVFLCISYTEADLERAVAWEVAAKKKIPAGDHKIHFEIVEAKRSPSASKLH